MSFYQDIMSLSLSVGIRTIISVGFSHLLSMLTLEDSQDSLACEDGHRSKISRGHTGHLPKADFSGQSYFGAMTI